MQGEVLGTRTKRVTPLDIMPRLILQGDCMNWQELIYSLVKLWKGKLVHKIALSLIAIGATGFIGSWVTVALSAILKEYFHVAVADTPVWTSLAILALGLVIASPEIYRELKHPPHPHDVALLAQFRELIDARTKRFLRDRPFYEPMHRYPVDRLEQFNHEWQGAQFEFRNPKVQTALADLSQSVDTFLNDFALGVWVMDRMPEFFTVKNRQDERLDGFTPETEQKVRHMVELASDADRKMDAFERAAIADIG